MKRVFCDCCGKDCGNTWYKISIFAYPSNDESYLTTMDAATQNIATYNSKVKHYCSSCKNKVNKFIDLISEDTDKEACGLSYTDICDKHKTKFTKTKAQKFIDNLFKKRRIDIYGG